MKEKRLFAGESASIVAKVMEAPSHGLKAPKKRFLLSDGTTAASLAAHGHRIVASELHIGAEVEINITVKPNSKARSIRRAERCWYCLCYTYHYDDGIDGRRNMRTVEHLIAKSNGGNDSKENLRIACKRCNSYVSDWPLEDKLKFRFLIQQAGSWKNLTNCAGGGGAHLNRWVRGRIETIVAPKGRAYAEVRRMAAAWWTRND